MNVERLLAEYGIWALGIGAGIEGETVVVLGGIMVHRGLLPLLPAILATAIGSFVADQLFFLLGRRFRSHPFVQRMQARPAFQRTLAAFERHPTLFVFAFRFLYGLRTISPVAIGTTRLSGMRFLVINAAAALLWGATFITVGYLFGHAFEAMFGRVQAVGRFAIPIVLAVAVIGLLVHLFQRHRHAGDDRPE